MALNRANRAEKELEKIFGEFNMEQLLVDLYFYFDCLSKRKTYYLNCVIFLSKRLKKLSDFTTWALYEKCFFGPYFIRFEYGEIRTGRNLVIEHFSRSEGGWAYASISHKPLNFMLRCFMLPIGVVLVSLLATLNVFDTLF